MPATISLLIVEDDQEFLELRARWFTQRGYSVTPVQHPRQALGAAAVRSYDVAILDRSLPEQNGVELMEKLHGRVAGLVAVVLSGAAEPAYEQEARARGACEYLLKPCSLARLEKVVERALAERRAGAQGASAVRAKTTASQN